MSRNDTVTIHDGRGNAISLDKPRNGGSVTIDFNGPIVCLKSVDHYGTVQEQKCIALPQPTSPSGGSPQTGGKSGCGCP